MPFPTMTATVAPTAYGFDVTITHHVAQSYSRAVDPKGIRIARTAPEGRGAKRVTLTGGDYGHTMVGSDRCLSTLRFEIAR